MFSKANEKTEIPFIRVGDDYYKFSSAVKSNGEVENELRRITRQTIMDDHGNKFLSNIPKYDRFCCIPDHINYKAVHESNYNQYHPFEHKAKKGGEDDIPWTLNLLKHVFGDQIEFGLDYIQLLYQKPTQILPILCLVSYENQTGKTTFLNWLFMLFKYNMIILGNTDLESNFNGLYAHKLIIAIDESKIDKSKVLERIKSLATARNIVVNNKYIASYTIDFFGKIILCSNYEDAFINAKDEDIRYWIRKLSKPTNPNFNIDEDLKKEIPYFLHYLQNRGLYIKKRESRMWFNPEDICTQELKAVRDHSKSWLYKELFEVLEGYFNNDGSAKDYVEVIPDDLKKQFFINNSKVETNYIRRVLKTEYKLEPQSIRKYNGLGDGIYKTGRPFRIDRNIFMNGNNIENGESGENGAESIDNTVDIPF